MGQPHYFGENTDASIKSKNQGLALLQAPSRRRHERSLPRLPARFIWSVGRSRSEYPDGGADAGAANGAGPLFLFPPFTVHGRGGRPHWRRVRRPKPPELEERRAGPHTAMVAATGGSEPAATGIGGPPVRRWQQAATLRQWVANRRRWQSAPLDTLRLHLAAEQINDSVDALARTQLSTFEPWLRRAFKPSGPPASLSCFIPAGSR